LVTRERCLLDQDHLYRSLAKVIGPYTFEEAEARSGRSLNISISPTQLHQRPRLLSSVTSPQVLVSKAVLASSAVPVVFPAVALTQRSETGEEIPYIPHERWVDGSVHGDIPMSSVARLHNVTNFIVSQVNPHVAPFIRGRQASGVVAFSAMGLALRTQSSAWAGLFSRVVSMPTFARSTKQFADMLTQEYVGDINILPELDAGAFARLFANPTTDDLRHYIDRGMQATWPRIARIRDQSRVRRALEQSIAELRQSVRSDRSTAPRGA
jgi:NTE family protein